MIGTRRTRIPINVSRGSSPAAADMNTETHAGQ
jgi:hypothetical protein